MRNALLFLSLICFCLLTIQCQKGILPIGVFPAEGHAIAKKFAKNPVFKWKAMEFRDGRDFSYQVRVLQVDSVVNNERSSEYFLSDILDEKVKTTFLRYPSKAPRLQEGKIYAWEVSTVDDSGREATVKELTSFTVGDGSGELAQVPLDFTGFCTHSYVEYENGRCINRVAFVPCPDKIHMATGNFTLGGGGGQRLLAGASGYNNGCFDLDDNSEIFITCKYIITVPDGVAIGTEQVFLKVFENQNLIPDANIAKDYHSLKSGNFSFNSPTFSISQVDYKPICVGTVVYQEAVILIDFKLKMEYNTPYNLLKNYELVLDLVPAGNTNHYLSDTGAAHDHSALLSAPLPAPCTGLLPGDYNYYKCLDQHENVSYDFHQGRHIVMMPIRLSSICGPWNLHVPVPVPESDTYYPVTPY